jgi:hypothetical protein
VAARLGSEVGHQEGDDEAAGDRHKDDQRAPGARAGELVGVVDVVELSGEGDVMNEADQRPKKYGADVGNETDEDRQKRQLQQIQS